jgi:hypothetical protein
MTMADYHNRGLAIIAAVLLGGRAALGVSPAFSVSEHGLDVGRVEADCPIVYDNDWWKDTPDAAYLWAKASLGEADLVAVSRRQRTTTKSPSRCRAKEQTSRRCEASSSRR